MPSPADRIDPLDKAALAAAPTEALDERFAGLDAMSALQIARLINEEDRKVAPAVERVLDAVAGAADLIVERMRGGGRLFYVGAGTSGRLGVVDASECPPTYGVGHDLVQAVIAGGDRAVFRSREGAEDDRDAGATDIALRGLTDRDVVVGISTSGRAPYVLGALAEARRVGAATVALGMNPGGPLESAADIAITPNVGPEVVMGSTRMKAGTATKMVLNMLTTIAMVRIGRVRGNLMVDMRPSCSKLRDRAERIVATAAGVEPERAREALAAVDGDVRRAIDLLAGDGAG